MRYLGRPRQPAPGHGQRLLLFRNHVLRTHQRFRRPHLSLCTGAVSQVIDRPKVVLRPIPRRHSFSEIGDWNPGIMGHGHIRFRQARLRNLYLVTMRSVRCCADWRNGRDPQPSHVRIVHRPQIHKIYSPPHESTGLLPRWAIHCLWLFRRHRNLGYSDRRSGQRD